jgi:hypothetical protein
LNALPDAAENIFEIGGFPAPSRADKNDFNLNLFGLGINERHGPIPLFVECGR